MVQHGVASVGTKHGGLERLAAITQSNGDTGFMQHWIAGPDSRLPLRDVMNRRYHPDDNRQTLAMNETENDTHTGRRCISVAEGLTHHDFAAAANLMKDTGVPHRMLKAWRQAVRVDNPVVGFTDLTELTELMVNVLAAGRGSDNGDLRGHTSASLMVIDDHIEVASVICTDGSDPIERLRAVAFHPPNRNVQPVVKEWQYHIGQLNEARRQEDDDAVLHIASEANDALPNVYRPLWKMVKAGALFRKQRTRDARDLLSSLPPNWLETARRDTAFWGASWSEVYPVLQTLCQANSLRPCLNEGR